ncbi:MAG TPA: hypothetical protein VFF37_16445 [Streptomyces sp.]|nr:hypothetical protein [Streptomyces sp.]
MAGDIHIAVAVDVAAALSGTSPDDVVFLMDDGPLASEGKGTSRLITNCVPGQLVRWRSYAIDLQTPVSIKAIRFSSWLGPWGYDQALERHDVASGGAGEDWANDSLDWSGIVPASMLPGLAYRYRLTVQMGTGSNALMSFDTSALKRVG